MRHSQKERAMSLKIVSPAKWWCDSVAERGDCAEIVGLGDGPLTMSVSLHVQNCCEQLSLEQIVWPRWPFKIVLLVLLFGIIWDHSIRFLFLRDPFPKGKIILLPCPFIFLLTRFYHDLCLPLRDHTYRA